MRVLADTNVLARIAQPDHHQHNTALDATERIIDKGHDVCIVPQVVYEFWVISTRPKSANGLGFTVAQTVIEIEKASAFLTLFRDEVGVYDIWQQLVSEYSVMGKKAHDARLIASMVCQEMTHLLTFNDSDFARFRDVTILTPDSVLTRDIL